MAMVSFTYRFDSSSAAVSFKEDICSFYAKAGSEMPVIDASKLSLNQITVYGISHSGFDLRLFERLNFFASKYHGYIVS